MIGNSAEYLCGPLLSRAGRPLRAEVPIVSAVLQASGIDIGLREHATAEQQGDGLGVDRVVFGLATMDR
jgi:hypothetical protein